MSGNGITDDDTPYALNQPYSPTSGYNALHFAMDMKQHGVMTCAICKVVKLQTDGNGAVGPIGRVVVQPLVQMVDGIQRTVDHTSVYNLPYIRMVGGKGAVIIDPAVGDIGIVVSCDRDISGVKNSQGLSPPGSQRRFNIADGIFIGACLAAKPNAYVQFRDENTIICGIGDPASALECVIAKDHVQMKQKGQSNMHFTVDAATGQLLIGQALVIAPDPFPND